MTRTVFISLGKNHAIGQNINTSKLTNCLLRVRISALFAGRVVGGGSSQLLNYPESQVVLRSVVVFLYGRYRGRERPAVDCRVGGGSAPSY